MTANVISYRGKSAAREVGKALGFDQESLGRLTSLVSQWEWRGENDTMANSFHHAGFDVEHPRIAKYLELCVRLQDLPRHLGVELVGVELLALSLGEHRVLGQVERQQRRDGVPHG